MPASDDDDDLTIELSDDENEGSGEGEPCGQRGDGSEHESAETRQEHQDVSRAPLSGGETGAGGDCHATSGDGEEAVDEEDLEIQLSDSEAEANNGTEPRAANALELAARDGGGDGRVPRRGGIIPRKGSSKVVSDVVILDDSESEPAKPPSLPPQLVAAECQVGEKRTLKRNEMDEVSTHFKKGKKAADALPEVRNLMKVKLQEMTPEEMQAVISFPPPKRGLGPKRLVIHMEHPRILEPPHSADLMLYLHAQLDDLLGGGSKFLWTDRCSGFMAFYANLSCLFTGCEAQGVSVAKLGRFLTSDRDLNTKVLTFTSRLMLAPEVEEHVAAGRSAAAGGVGGGWGGGSGAVPGETDAFRENMAGILWHSLVLLHNYIEFEMQFVDETKYQILTQELVADPQLMLLYRRSLDMLEVPAA